MWLECGKTGRKTFYDVVTFLVLNFTEMCRLENVNRDDRPKAVTFGEEQKHTGATVSNRIEEGDTHRGTHT